MAKSINQFNGLHGLVVPREQLLALQKLAKKENQKHLESWLDATLKSKKNKKLLIEILNPVLALPVAKKVNAPGLNVTYGEEKLIETITYKKEKFEIFRKSKGTKAFFYPKYNGQRITSTNFARKYDAVDVGKKRIDFEISKSKETVPLGIERAKSKATVLAINKNNSQTKSKTAVPSGTNKISLLEKMGFTRANLVPEKAADIYTLPNGIGEFLQQQQPRKSAILIKGNKHSSKSQLAMQIANAYGELGHAVAYIDYEQGGIESKDTVDSINRNTTLKGRKNIAIIGYLETPYEDLQKFCKVVKVIVADSITDLKITADQLNELRNNYPETTWIFISQVKENGEMYGGNKMAHNPTVVINCTSDTDFTKRIATLEKNRGNNLEIKYSMFTQNIVKEVKPKKEKKDGKAKK